MTDPFLARVSRMVDAQVKAESEAAGQMTLGALISALEACKADSYVQFVFAGLCPGRLRSYRGFYDHLAIDPSGEFRHVGEFLAHAKSVLGSTMTGYKGGEYVMDDDTPVWVAPWGDTSTTRVVGVQNEDWRVKILTVETDD